jgi:hypothetical protein
MRKISQPDGRNLRLRGDNSFIIELENLNHLSQRCISGFYVLNLNGSLINVQSEFSNWLNKKIVQ